MSLQFTIFARCVKTGMSGVGWESEMICLGQLQMLVIVERDCLGRWIQGNGFDFRSDTARLRLF